MLRPLLLLAAFGAPIVAGDVAPVPPVKPEAWKELVCEVGQPVVLTAGEGAKGVAWKLIDEAGANLTTVPDSSHAVFYASKAGRFKFASISDGKASWCVMVAGDAPPGPPGPTPPPKPVDDLTKSLQAAYSADASATKAADLRQLIALYLSAVEFARDDQSLQSAADLFARVSQAAGKLLPDVDGVRRLAGVRKIIGGELQAVLPADPDAPLSDMVRAGAAVAFAKYAKALQGVAP